MKYFWGVALAISYVGLYICSFLAFSSGFDIVAFPMIIGGSTIIGAITYQYALEYWI